MSNSRMASLDNFGYFPQRFSVVKMTRLPTDIPSMLYEHPQSILKVQTLSFTRSDWRLIIYLFCFWKAILKVIYTNTD